MGWLGMNSVNSLLEVCLRRDSNEVMDNPLIGAFASVLRLSREAHPRLWSIAVTMATEVVTDKPNGSPLDHSDFVDERDGVQVPYCGGILDDRFN